MDIPVRCSLRKKGKHYHAVFYHPGRNPTQKWVALGTTDKRVAEERLGKMRLKQERGKFDPWTGKDLAEASQLSRAVEQYMSTRQNKRRSAATLRGDEQALRFLTDYLRLEGFTAQVMLSQIEKRHAEGFVEKLLCGGLADATVRTYQSRLKAFFSWGVREGYLETNPFKDVEMQRVARRHPRFLTREQYGAVLTAVRDDEQAKRMGESAEQSKHTWVPEGAFAWIAAIVTVAVGTGLRLAEICHMRWHWVNLSEGFIRVQHERDFRPKSYHERTVFFGEDVRAVLTRLYEERVPGAEYVFSGRLQDKATGHVDAVYVSKRVKYFLQKAGLPEDYTFHTLRHTYASWLAMGGASPFAIKELLGHADLKTTERYSHMSPERLRAAVAGVFGRS